MSCADNPKYILNSQWKVGKMKFRCFFGFHNYLVIKVENYIKRSIFKHDDGIDATFALYKCQDCGKLDTVVLDGYKLTIKDLKD